MSNFGDEHLAEAREVFQYFDTRGDGMTSAGQIGDILRALGLNPTQSEINKCCNQWKDAETRVNFEQFAPIYQSLFKTQDTRLESEFVDGLAHFDKEGNGIIKSAELRHLLTTLGEKLSDEEVDQLLTGHDNDGVVNLTEFVKDVINN